MEIERRYRSSGIPASAIRPAIDLLVAGGSSVIGNGWAHNLRKWRLLYESEDIVCDGVDEMRAAVAKSGDTLRFSVKYASTRGRVVSVDATDGTRIVVKVANGADDAIIGKD